MESEYGIRLESKNKLLSICFGYLQPKENSLFLPVAIGVSVDGVYIYVDHVADEVTNNVYKYKSKKYIPRLKIDYVYVENYSVDLEYREYGRVQLVMRKDPLNTFTFFYKMEDEKYVDDFLNKIKEAYHINVKHRTKKKWTLT